MVETWKITSDAKEPLSSLDKLRGYQIVILGRDLEAFLDDAAIENLRTWIAQQGGVRCAIADRRRSRRILSWRNSCPCNGWPDLRLAFTWCSTPQGRDLNWLQMDALADDPLPRLPSLAAGDDLVGVKPLAVVLANATLSDGSKEPAVVFHPYGIGRVVAVEGAGMWRWAFLPPEYQSQEIAYASLWHSMMRG